DDFAFPNGTQGHRWDGDNKWNLELEKADGSFINPQLSFLEDADETVQVEFPYFAGEESDAIKRGVPVKQIKDKHGNQLPITTVFDLMMAHTGVDRGLPGDYPTDYNDKR